MPDDPGVPRFRAAVITLVLAAVLVPASASMMLLALVPLSTMLFTALHKSAPKETAPARPQRAGLVLNAAFGFRLGCETYLLNRRLLPAANMEVSQ
ncbi:MAG: hypothetical protein HOW71_28095 [Nonomuraea sp.]|nr:hypothetical protein [Nonomuraea sp.]